MSASSQQSLQSGSAQQVVVIGAGPTGLALAAEVALAGVPCRVLERREARTRDSRAICLHARSVEMLALRGLAKRFVAAGFPVPSFPLGLKGAIIDFSRLDSDFPYILDMPQSQIEDLLEVRARELGVEIVRSSTVTAVEQDEREVRLRVAGPGGERVERAAYAVGCDGLHSAVRKSLGIPFPGFPNPGSVSLADLYLDDLSMDDAYGELTEAGMLLVFPFQDRSCRVVLYDYARAGLPTTEPVTLEEVRSSLVRVTGSDFGARDVYWSSRYRSESRQVPDYRAGRVFLAGDAAHTHSPAGAQGLNAGFQDAFNLGWKLAGTLAGWAPDWLLDSYNAERHPVGADVLRLTGRQFKLNVARTRRRQLLRWAAYRLLRPLPPVQQWLADQYSGLAVRYAPPAGAHPLTGRRLPRGRLTGVEGTVSGLYDLFADGRFVLLSKPAPGEPLPDQVRPVPFTGASRRGWPEAVLVRPDGYVAWAADQADPAAIRSAVREWCDAGAGAASPVSRGP